MASIARKNLLHDRTRFAITIVGVTFSVVLIFIQFGLYLAFMRNASVIIDHTDADIWITSKNSANFDFPLAFPETKLNKVKEVPGVAWADYVSLVWVNLKLKDGGSESIELIGFNPDTGVGGPWRLRSGRLEDLKAGSRIIIDESAAAKLGRLAVGDTVEVLERKLTVVGISEGVKSFTTAPYVFTSYRTVKDVFPWLREKTVFIVARVAPGYSADEVVQRLRQVRDVDAFTRDEYSAKTRWYWTWATGIGIGFALTALMGIVVGVVIVGQTIYSATLEHLREFGTLKAIGATNRDIYRIVGEQALINAVVGYAVGLALTVVIRHSFQLTGLAVHIPLGSMVLVFAVTVAMCLTASIISVRKAVRVDPMIVFRA